MEHKVQLLSQWRVSRGGALPIRGGGEVGGELSTAVNRIRIERRLVFSCSLALCLEVSTYFSGEWKNVG